MFSEICIITRDITLPSVPLHFRKPRPRPFHFQGINFGPPGRFNKNPSWKVPFWRWFSELPQVGYVNFLGEYDIFMRLPKKLVQEPPLFPIQFVAPFGHKITVARSMTTWLQPSGLRWARAMSKSLGVYLGGCTECTGCEVVRMRGVGCLVPSLKLTDL